MTRIPAKILEQLNNLSNPGMAQAAAGFFEIKGDLPAAQFLKEGINALCPANAAAGEKQQQKGAALELLFCILLIREGITPFYTQAELIFVPNARFDVLLYTTRRGVMTISLKTSLRERWKQADLEALAVKHVHRRSTGILASLPMDERNEAEVANLEHKVSEGNVLGLDMMINLANQSDAELLLKTLKEAEPRKAPTQLGPLLPSARVIE